MPHFGIKLGFTIRIEFVGIPHAHIVVPFQSGIRNVHPKPGEPAMFTDQYSTAPTEEGIAYALITHLPGPLRNNDVESFTSDRSAGYVGAVCGSPIRASPVAWWRN